MDVIKINFGKYDGESLMRVPVSYLKWAVTNGVDRMLRTPTGAQPFHELAKAELTRRGERTDSVEISAHAIDRVSTRFLEDYIKTKREVSPGKWEGLYSWIERHAAKAAEKSIQASGIVRINHVGICWVFDFSMALPVLKTVVHIR